MRNPKEGKMTIAIEEETSRIPSVVYLTAGLAAIVASITLKCLGHKHTALIVGQLSSPFLIMGLYNKIVKTEGHD